MKKIKYGKVERTCLHCGINFLSRHDRPGKYCSRKCSTKYSRPMGKTYFEFYCNECNVKFKKEKGQLKYNKYCSRICSIKAIKNGKIYRPKGSDHPGWHGGITKRPYIARKTVLAAKKIKKECEKCGSKENLQGHHIIKYSERPDLCDDINNIEVICRNCHAFEHPEIANMLSYPVKRTGKIINCIICNKERYIVKHLFKTAKFCSRKCQLINLHALRREKENGRKMD